MRKGNRGRNLAALLLALVLLLSACVTGAFAAKKTRKTRATPPPVAQDALPEETAEPGPREAAQALADYLFEYGELPDTFLTKKELQALGWRSWENDISDVAPGMSVGGDYFGNYEGKLPRVRGRKYYEADCFYTGGRRNAYRIIYSDDGHVWYTEDHYNTFTELFPSVRTEGE